MNKFEVRLNNPYGDEMNYTIIGYANTQEEAEEIINKDKAGERDMLLFGAAVYCIISGP